MLALMLVFASSAQGQDSTAQQLPIAAEYMTFADASTDDLEAVDEGGYVSAGSGLDATWDRANTAYVNGNYQGAIDEYKKILATGNTSARLHYNLANAYYKVGQIGHAVLNYRRADLLDPSDRDINYNLEIAQTQVRDKIAEVPVFFLLRYVSALRSSLSSNAWAQFALAMFALAAIMVVVFLLARPTAVRKAGFITAIAALVLFVASLSFSLAQRRVIVLQNEAVVMSGAVAVKSSPDRESKDIFILHEGTPLTILNTLGEWSEVMIADGNKGWMPNNAFEKISLAQ